MTEATVHELRPEAPAPKEKRKRKKKSKFSLKTIFDAGTPLLHLGLNVLDQARAAQPYMAALRLLAAAGQTYLTASQTQETIEKIKKLRKRIAALPPGNVLEHNALKAKLEDTLDKL